jgi:hypothetical protein
MSEILNTKNLMFNLQRKLLYARICAAWRPNCMILQRFRLCENASGCCRAGV